MKKLAILGAGGHGRVVADTATLAGWQQVVFFDDSWPERDNNLVWPIVGDWEQLKTQLKAFDGVVVALGNNVRRMALSQEIIALGGTLATLIHPAAVVSSYARIGDGSVVFAGAIINSAAEIGLAAIINTAATIDHDCVLGDGVHISPGAHLGGTVRVGALSWVGIGACVRHSVQLGSEVVVGAGAAVVRPVADGLTVVGVPAKVRKTACERSD